MPVEHEIPYVLKITGNPFYDDKGHIHLEDFIERNGLEKSRIYAIHQSYLTENHRLRKIIKIKKDFFKADNIDDINKRSKFIETSKWRVGNKIIELENPLSESDYLELLTICHTKLFKVRISVDIEKYYHWDIDFYYDNNIISNNQSAYFCMAECEYDASLPEPSGKYIPEYVKSNFLYKGSKKDERFNNRFLADVEKTKPFYQSLVNGTFQG